ncbi:uncharacterized protein [Fopius arisanus]|uniref:Uncharacterized protein n=1 Tax=Fopius arisanus TaxID=64838 RepID=A0A9R1STY1_9HYME|nr:PREDICTED: uncharacterized protein LOC105262908 [Fopius arisanus]
MTGDEGRSTDISVSMSSDTSAEIKKLKKNDQKSNQSPKNPKSSKNVCKDWEPSECLCHAYRITSCVPPMNLDEGSGEINPSSPRKFSWKWPRPAPRSEKPYTKFETTRGIDPNPSRVLPPNITRDFQEIHKKFKNITGKIEIYYFDHGNASYYRTTDAIPLLTMEKFADKTDQAATRFWAEFFGTINIGITFITAFLLQLLRFTLYSLIRPLTIGIIQLLSDYLIKPLLTIIFNALIQPVLILLYNIATSLRDLCEPIAEAIGFFIRELSRLFQAIRLVEVNRNVINGNIPT